MTSKSILVFDFDGVISNSVHDSFRTALNTYIAFRPVHSLPVDRALGTAAETYRFETDHPGLFDLFCKLIPLGSHAEDYYTIFTLLDRKAVHEVKSQGDFDAYRKAIPDGEQKAYHALFYEIRNALQKKDPKDWAGLMPVFPEVAEALPVLSERFILAIATAKDLFSVNLQLKEYGIERYFLPENILDKDFAKAKLDHLTLLRRRHGVPFERIHFIDDKVLHLVSVAGLGVRCYLAVWGFNTRREHSLAKKHGFVLLKLEELKDLGKMGEQNAD